MPASSHPRSRAALGLALGAFGLAAVLGSGACSGTGGVAIGDSSEIGARPPTSTDPPASPVDPDSGNVTLDDPDGAPPNEDAGPLDAGGDAEKPPIKDASADVVDASDAGDSGLSPVCSSCLVKDCKAPYDACMNDAMCRVLSACLDACATSACRNGCFAKYPDPAAKAKNGALYSCKCFDACAAACTNDCR